MNYSIPWHLLAEDDADFFGKVEIELGAAFLKFHRELTREEMASVCSRLWDFRGHIPDADDNHINFAIGDAMDKYKSLFGDTDGEHFIQEFFQLTTLRDNTHKVMGQTLVYLQKVEHQIKGCCAMMGLKGLKLSLEDFQSSDPNRRRQTLGKLKNALLETKAYTSDFEERFNSFVKDRNHFVHSLWTDEIEMDDRLGLPSKNYFANKFEFTISVIRQAHEMDRVFRGFLALIFESLAEHMKNSDLVIPWKKHIAEYRAVLRGSN